MKIGKSRRRSLKKGNGQDGRRGSEGKKVVVGPGASPGEEADHEAVYCKM